MSGGATLSSDSEEVKSQDNVQPWNSGGDAHHANLAERVTNPISLLGRFKLKEAYSPSYLGKAGSGNTFELQGLIPIPRSGSTEVGQLIRITAPLTRPVDGSTALGDVQIFDMFTMETDWGLVGIGPTAVLPTAGTMKTGKGKWQIGPAVAVFYTKIPHLQLGVLAQNPISVAGDSSRSAVSQLLLQPHVTWHVGDGWYVNSDPQMSFNWIDNGRDIPVNVGLGRVFKVSEQPVNLNLQYEWTAYSRNTTAAAQTIKLNLEFVFP